MGFKCPICKKDFGNDKESFEEHIENSHYGIGKEIISTIKNITNKNKKGE